MADPIATDAVAPAVTLPTLDEYRRMFNAGRDAMSQSREDSQLSRDYYDNRQLTREDRATLLARKQPPVIFNRINRAVDGIVGVVLASKTDPKALMRNPPDPDAQPQQQAIQPGQPGPNQPPPKTKDAGDVATMVLRFIKDTTHFDEISQASLTDGLIEGCGAAITEIGANEDVAITQIPWSEFFYDPRSRRRNFKDARWLGIAKWMYADNVAALYADQLSEDGTLTAQGKAIDQFGRDGTGITGDDWTWEDKPRDVVASGWVDSKLKRLMVVDMYHSIGGEWYRCVFHAGGKLEEGPSAYKDDKGKSVCPIEAWSCYVNRDNERYGIVQGMRDIQDSINMRHSKALHEANVRQLQVLEPDKWVPSDPEEARREAARPDGIIPTGYTVVNRSDVVANNFQMMTIAMSELERMAAAPAILGRQGADASGRSVQLRQQAGLTELSPVLSGYTDWLNRMYTQAWWRCVQFWKSPKWIRVTNSQQAPEYIRVNEPVAPAMPNLPPDHPAMAGMAMPQQQVKNHIAEMDVDIILDSVPDTATLQQEQFNELAQLAQGRPQEVPFLTLLKLSSITNKNEIISELEGAAQQQQQVQQVQMQAQMAKMQGDIQLLQSNILRNQAQAGLLEAQTVTTAMQGHLDVTNAAKLPPGIIMDGSGKPTSVLPQQLLPNEMQPQQPQGQQASQ